MQTHTQHPASSELHQLCKRTRLLHEDENSCTALPVLVPLSPPETIITPSILLACCVLRSAFLLALSNVTRPLQCCEMLLEDPGSLQGASIR